MQTPEHTVTHLNCCFNMMRMWFDCYDKLLGLIESKIMIINEIMSMLY